MLLGQRNHSVNWEPLPLDPSGQIAAWVWFRPATAPYGLTISIPPMVFANPQILPFVTVRNLLAATGYVEERILFWSVSGMTYDAVGGTSPLLDQVLPPDPAGGNVDLTIWIEPLPQLVSAPDPQSVGAFYPGASAMSVGATGSASCSDSDLQLLGAIDSTWNGILQLEARVGSLRKDLGSAISRLNSLNRDLSADERRTCDNKDKQDWQDARRWLRDSLSTLSRSVKEIDVGTTSGAGSRHKFEDIYKKFVVTRTPFPGLSQAVTEFEGHRKTVQNVVAAAQASLAKAGRDAEQRANSVLVRIAAKMRAARR